MGTFIDQLAKAYRILKNRFSVSVKDTLTFYHNAIEFRFLAG